MEAARLRDENSSPSSAPGGLEHAWDLPAAFDEGSLTTEARGIQIQEALLCSRAGEVLYQWKCESLENRLELFKRLEQTATEAAKGTPSGRFHRISMALGPSRLVVQLQPTYKLLVRSALPSAPPTPTHE